MIGHSYIEKKEDILSFLLYTNRDFPLQKCILNRTTYIGEVCIHR